MKSVTERQRGFYVKTLNWENLWGGRWNFTTILTRMAFECLRIRIHL